ncbi:hypothetical protein [Nocardioides terrigena]|uniref:hypothetical protein n=1 Tax=Nocardioides terrigena TaxID=424797 RepID=UPI00131F1ED5|nr:hypothetical protein [Nocardioides terrigena]
MVNHPDEIRQWTARQIATRRAYRLEPFAGARDMNDTDRARERMAASRAAKRTNNTQEN